jgi:hypothetical protein
MFKAVYIATENWCIIRNKQTRSINITYVEGKENIL